MVRVLIVGEIRLYRDGLAEVLGRRSDLEIVGAVAAQIEAFDAVSRLHPDIVVLDMATPASHGMVAQIRNLVADVKVIALGVADVEGEVIGCAEAGVAGYVPREGSLDHLVDAIWSAVRGELRCSPRLAGSLLRRIAALSAQRQDAGLAGSLTSRESEVLSLIDQGCSNKDIARRLGIEVATVKNHVHNLLDKLHVHRRGQAAARARYSAPNRKI
jgi:two-component system nitrate/nitrite response regulator NarL